MADGPSEMELASLIASRLCHDVVGPVGAIENGLELIAEDASMAEVAMDLIRKSAQQASARLQFARLAYGAVGGADTLDPLEAGRLTEAVFAGERAELAWRFTDGPAPRNAVKLAMLLATYALGAIPRGGQVSVESKGSLPLVRAEGELRTPPFLEIVTGTERTSDPRGAQALAIQHLAHAAGVAIHVSHEDTTFTLSARPLS